MMKRNLLLVLLCRMIGAALAVLLFTLMPVQAQDTTLRECAAIIQDVGRSEASMSSELARWPDNRLKLVEVGDALYTSDDLDDLQVRWIELFGAQNGHGSSLLGLFLKDNFECKLLEE